MNHITTTNQNYDVLIIGAGWAGLTLARQLKLKNPDLNILQLEANTEFKAKVGEATVEIAGHYFMHRLGLVNYLYRNHLPKNGLRFFFDSESHDLNLDQMSEHGTTSIPPHPAFQLDRARLEKDLVDMNRAQGINLLLGAKVKTIAISEKGEHQINFNYQEQKHEVKATWLIDASGRASLLAKQQKLHHRDDVPKNCSAWARFSNVTDIDSLGSKEWQNKVNGRFLSTIHFTGPGYWIWVIPLSGGFTSVGIVCDKTVMKNAPLKQAQFIEFLQKHKGLWQLLSDAKLKDFEAWGQLAYRGKEYISEQRWATTGFAAMFLDPLYSSGCDMIALTNDAISKTICDDFAFDSIEQANQSLIKKVPILNQQAHEIYQTSYAAINNSYPILDCAQLCSPVVAYTTAIYFLETTWDYMAGNFIDLDYWQNKDYLRRGYSALEKVLNKQILATVKTLEEQGRYFDRNHEGFFESGAELYKYFVYELGQSGKDGWRIDLHIKLWTDVYLKVTESRLNLPGFSNRMLIQACLNLPKILALDTFSQTDLPELIVMINQKLTEELQQLTEHTVLAEIDEQSFTTGMVRVQDIERTLSEVDMKKLQRQANHIFNIEQDYMAMPFMVPYFLQLCRKTDNSIMSVPILPLETC
mgnify:CR=1 FL=1